MKWEQALWLASLVRTIWYTSVISNTQFVRSKICCFCFAKWVRWILRGNGEICHSSGSQKGFNCGYIVKTTAVVVGEAIEVFPTCYLLYTTIAVFMSHFWYNVILWCKYSHSEYIEKTATIAFRSYVKYRI